jgi:hypothetical protein
MSTATPPDTSPNAAPNKVCPHCGAMNQTAAKKCPSCGKGYKKRTFLKVFVGLCVLGVVVIVGCATLLGTAANQVVKQLDKEQQAHAITRQQFRGLSLGLTERQVIVAVGRHPEDRQEFQSKSFVTNEPDRSSCIYYNRANGSFGDVFQLCFDNDRLESKNSY